MSVRLSAPALQWQSKKKIESLIGEEGSHATRGDRRATRSRDEPRQKSLTWGATTNYFASFLRIISCSSIMLL